MPRYLTAAVEASTIQDSSAADLTATAAPQPAGMASDVEVPRLAVAAPSAAQAGSEAGHQDRGSQTPAPREDDATEVDGADSESGPADETGVETVPDIAGVGADAEASAYSLTLNGRTDASFSNSFRTSRVRTRPSTECADCSGDGCVTVTGTLISTFRVTTTVTLPRVSDFPDLTACQRQRVRDGINNVLAPHEQQHVTAFRAYRGTVRTPFSLTLCRADLDSSVQAIHDAVEADRRSAVQAASDALDPFSFDVDLDCP